MAGKKKGEAGAKGKRKASGPVQVKEVRDLRGRKLFEVEVRDVVVRSYFVYAHDEDRDVLEKLALELDAAQADHEDYENDDVTLYCVRSDREIPKDARVWVMHPKEPGSDEMDITEAAAFHEDEVKAGQAAGEEWATPRDTATLDMFPGGAR